MTVELAMEVPVSLALIDLPLPSSCLATLRSLTLSIVEAPSARLKEALPMTTVLTLLPCLTLAVRLRWPSQAPPEQVILRAAFPFLTRAEPAALAWPGGGGGHSEALVAQVGCGLALKVAVTVVLPLIVTTQLATPEQPPPEKPEKVEPDAAEAVRLTFVPCS